MIKFLLFLEWRCTPPLLILYLITFIDINCVFRYLCDSRVIENDGVR
jgi:hypothetical protein